MRSMENEISQICIGCSTCKQQNLKFQDMRIKPWGNALLFTNATECPDCGDKGVSLSILDNLSLARREGWPYFYSCGFCGSFEFVDRESTYELLSTDTKLQVFRAKCNECSREISITNYFGRDARKVEAFWKDDLKKNLGIS